MINLNRIIFRDNPIEITRDNWVIGDFLDIESSILYELHYCKSDYYKGGILIDDVWMQEEYNSEVKEKIDIYLLDKSCSLLDDFDVDDRYCFFLNYKNVKKKFLSIDNIYSPIYNSIRLKYNNLYSSYLHKKIKPVLSIITTVYNNTFLLEQTLQSVINQDSDSFEYIIKDACSIDGFDDMIGKYKDYGIVVIKEKDRGIYYGMDQGIRASQGEYIQILNSDDIFYSKDILSVYVKEINKKTAEAYCSDILMYYKNGKKIKRKADLSKLKYRSCINHTSLALKYSDYIKLGGFDLSLSIAADCDLTIKLVKAGLNIKHLNITCVRFRAQGASNSTYTFKMLKENLICRYRFSTFNFLGYIFTLLQFLKLKFLKYK